MEQIDCELLKIINEKIELCAEWANLHNKNLGSELKKITLQIKEVIDGSR